MSTILEINNFTKTYRKSSTPVCALDNVSLKIVKGEMVIIRGPSGSGKSTLLLCCGGLLSPDNGTIALNGMNPYELRPNRRAIFRAQTVGFVFQRFHLVPYLSVLDNVLVAAVNKVDKRVRVHAMQLLKHFGMDARIGHKPGELSVGECQRTALARAMLNNPPLLLADEPTGNLDPENSRIVLNAIREYAANGKSILMVTHDPAAAGSTDRVLHLDHGNLQQQPISK